MKTSKNKYIDPVDLPRKKEKISQAPKKDKGVTERRSVTGIKKRVQAERIKINARVYDYNELDLIDARCLEREAEPYLKPLEPVRIGTGNEALPQQAEGVENEYFNFIKETLQENSDQINIDASLRRMERAADAMVLDTAIDASESIQARNSLEKMLAHQMAACHDQAMRLIAKANGIYEDTVAIQRLVNSSVRLMNTYQQVFQTLHKIRTGGHQVVTVQHVNVEGGGQAVVTGSVKTGGGEVSPDGV